MLLLLWKTSFEVWKITVTSFSFQALQATNMPPLYMYYLYIIVVSHLVSASTINTFMLDDIASEGSIISCQDGNPCHVFCNANESCSNATINCPSESYCAITCVGEESCRNTWIQAYPYNQSAFIDCIGDRSCQNAFIGGFHITESLTALTINCEGTSSCRGSTIFATGAKEVILSDCHTTGSCLGVTLFCPPNVDGVAKCTISRMFHHVVSLCFLTAF